MCTIIRSQKEPVKRLFITIYHSQIASTHCRRVKRLCGRIHTEVEQLKCYTFTTEENVSRACFVLFVLVAFDW